MALPTERERCERRAKASVIQTFSNQLMQSGEIKTATFHPSNLNPPSVKQSQPNWDVQIGTSQKVGQAEPGTLTAVLIFCSYKKAGGGWLNGAKAQEEDVSLNSTWGTQAFNHPEFHTNDPWGADGVLVADGFWLEQDNKTCIKKDRVIFTGVAAPNLANPIVAKGTDQQRHDRLVARLIKTLQVCQTLKCDRVVWGAIGCGVFAWDPKDSARALHEAAIRSSWSKPIVLGMTDERLVDVFAPKTGIKLKV